MLFRSNDTATTEIYTLSLHDALPIYRAQAKKANLRKLVLFPILKFFHNFIFLRGFRDGTTGFVLSVMMSLHSFLAWSSLYLNEHKE